MKYFLVYLFVSLFTCYLFYDFILPPVSNQSEFNQKIAKEALLEVTQLIQLYSYPAENHTIQTDDGYLITIHRIPGGKNYSNNKTQIKIPIYLQHGAWMASSSWVDTGEESWGFLLADAGYDVWMGNFRDNTYTRKINNDTTDDEIIGWDKLSVYEIPTIVDYIRDVTGFDQILGIGYSLGNTATFAALSTNKKLNNKIKGFVALAPVTGLRYSSSVIFKIFKVLTKTFPFIAKQLYKDSNFPAKHLRNDFILRLCPANEYSAICKLCFNYINGYNPISILDKTRLPIYIQHITDTFPDRFLFHWIQVTSTYKMQGYDYGKAKNFENYNQALPKEYDLTKIEIPVAVINAANDPISNPFDVEILCRQLPNLMLRKLLPGEMTTHLDVLFQEPKKLVKTILPVLSSMWN